MSERIYCKDCRFYENNLCHKYPPVFVPWRKESLYPDVDDNCWCGLAKLKEEIEIKAKEEAIERRRAEICERYERAFENLKSFSPNEPVTLKELAKEAGVTDYAIRKFIKVNWKDTFLRFRNGIVFATKDGTELD